jgi:hypothetical protein
VFKSVGFDIDTVAAQQEPIAPSMAEVPSFSNAKVVPTPASPSMAAPLPESPERLVKTIRGAKSAQMLEGIIPSSPSSFVRVLSKLIVNHGLATPPHRRRRAPAITLLPWCSAQLAKKVFHRAPVVAATQNVLMKKLDLSREGQLEAIDFERYVNLFNNGLTGGSRSKYPSGAAC